MNEVILKYFGGYPRICISFIFCRQSLHILEATWTLYFPVTRGGSLSLPSAMHARSIETSCLGFISPWQRSHQKMKALLGCRLKNRPASPALYIS
jgi:hypothetical protein